MSPRRGTPMRAAGVGAREDRNAALARFVGGAHHRLHGNRSRSTGSINGVRRVSSSTTEQPTSSPARIASSTKPAPGKTTAPDTAWSASQPCVAGDSRPVSTTPPEAGSSTTAPSNACSLTPSPSPVASAPMLSPDSQNRRRSKAYVGSSTKPAPSSTPRQSTATPATNAVAADVRNRSSPPSSRPSVGTTVTSAVPASPATQSLAVSSIPAINAGCGLDSMKVR